MQESAMKTATMPALRVDPELREAAESVLAENETLSASISTRPTSMPNSKGCWVPPARRGRRIEVPGAIYAHGA
jgi:hypothetical protein